MNKDIGDLAESIFVTRCLSSGISVCNPFGDNDPFDFITSHNGKLCRIQVKCTSVIQRTGKSSQYKVKSSKGGGSREKYSKKNIDFIAAYVIPEQVWYIIPIEHINSVTLALFPHIENSKGKHEKFRNKFSFLKGEEDEDSKKEIDNEDTVRNFNIV